MKTKIVKKVKNLLKFTVSRFLFFVSGVGVALVIYVANATYSPIDLPSATNTKLKAVDWEKMITNQADFDTRITKNTNHDGVLKACSCGMSGNWRDTTVVNNSWIGTDCSTWCTTIGATGAGSFCQMIDFKNDGTATINPC